MKKIITYEQLPMVALRGIVVFPGQLVNFDVGRKISRNANYHFWYFNNYLFVFYYFRLERNKKITNK